MSVNQSRPMGAFPWRMIQSSLLNHYNVIDCDNGYCFRTDSGNTYYITFIKYPTISDFLPVELGGGGSDINCYN